MAFPETGTKLANLFDPEVVGAMIDKKLVNKMVFAPLATIDNTLAGQPGDTLTLPYYEYIGDATDVNEAADIPIAQLSEKTVTKKVKKFGRGVQITDEAVLSAYGDPRTEAVKQLTLSIASKMDNDVLAELATISGAMAANGSAFSADAIADALTLFGEDIDDGARVLLINPANYAILRKADDWIAGTDVAANLIIRGSVGMIHGCQVIVSNKLAATTSYIVKPGALRILTKRNTLVETDRDIINKSTVITADRHAVAYLYDTSKAIKLTVPGTPSA